MCLKKAAHLQKRGNDTGMSLKRTNVMLLLNTIIIADSTLHQQCLNI